MKIIQVYAPTSAHDDETVEDLYTDIDRIMATENTSFTILMGDLNAKIGVRKDQERERGKASRICCKQKHGDWQYMLKETKGQILDMGKS